MNVSRIKMLAAAVALSAATMASAQFNAPQNARTRALAGAPLADITDIYSYPVLIMGYLNQAQVTWDADGAENSLGAVLLTKSFGDAVGVGIIANQGHLLSGAGDVGAQFDNANPPLQNVPHVLVGVDLGMLKIGADLFLELSSNNNSNTTGSTTTENYYRTMNAGVRLSADIAFGDLGILGKAGIGFPSIYSSIPGANNETVTTGAEKGLYVELGAEASYPVSDVNLTGGLEYTFADYQPGLPSNASGTNANPEYWHSLLRFYLGAEVNILETAAAVVRYEFARRASTTTNTIVTPPIPPAGEIVVKVDNTAGEVTHTFYAGAENIWDKAWIFDSFALRSGIFYQIAWDFTDVSNDNNDDKSHSGGPAAHNYIRPVIGAGISKGPVTLDVALNFARLFEPYDDGDYTDWRGPLTSPTLAVATATIKF